MRGERREPRCGENHVDHATEIHGRCLARFGRCVCDTCRRDRVAGAVATLVGNTRRYRAFTHKVYTALTWGTL